MQFNLVVAPIFLKTCVQDHGESSSRLLEKKDLIIVHGGDLVSGFVNRGLSLSFIFSWTAIVTITAYFS